MFHFNWIDLYRHATDEQLEVIYENESALVSLKFTIDEGEIYYQTDRGVFRVSPQGGIWDCNHLREVTVTKNLKNQSTDLMRGPVDEGFE